MKRKKVILAAALAVLCLTLSGSAWADYVDEVMADSPLAYYRFEDASSANGDTCVDSAGRVWKNGTYINSGTGADIALVSSYGVLGQAAQFSGANGGTGTVVDIYDPGEIFAQNMTVELWLNSSTSPDYSRLLQHNGAYDVTDCYGIGSAPTEGGAYITMIGGNNTWYTGTGNVFDGEWHHIVVTYEQQGADLYEYVYIDGVGKWGNTITGASLGWTYDRLTLGAEGNRWYSYNGLVGSLDEVAIYDTVLSSDRVAVHYEAAIPEPATLSLLGLGAVVLMHRKK